MFHKTVEASVYTLHSNPIAPTQGTNEILCLLAYISQTGYQCFPACFCHPTVGNFDVSPNTIDFIPRGGSRGGLLVVRIPVFFFINFKRQSVQEKVKKNRIAVTQNNKHIVIVTANNMYLFYVAVVPLLWGHWGPPPANYSYGRLSIYYSN